ncbi:MAG: glycogen synthase [Clostridia bacterium]|jgi:starch synthase|nr:glycogen synthase [Clostridia bacterium]
MRILFAAAEATPFAKTGGLGDVVGALPYALRKIGIDARVILPLYGAIPQAYRDRMTDLGAVTVKSSRTKRRCGLKMLCFRDVPVYFIENAYYFNRKRIYAYPDDAERFAFFCRAALESLPSLDFKPEILHLHDWHTALISVYLRSQYGSSGFCQGVKTVLTIHNLACQGAFSRRGTPDVLGLEEYCRGSYALPDFNAVNYLKGGLLCSDALTTVSPSYLAEITASSGDNPLGYVLGMKKDRFYSIINGIDDESYNPATDPALAEKFHSVSGKRRNKSALQRELGLEVNAETCLLAMVCRLTEQKGLDLLLQALPELLKRDIQLALLGTGEKHYEKALRRAAALLPGRVAVRLAFDEALARRIYAGADIFLMPSLTEPCGLAQLIALRYGAIPLVHTTGGLKDTVSGYNAKTKAGCGFCFTAYSVPAFSAALEEALALYGKPQEWNTLVKKAARMDHSWRRPAKEYAALYTNLLQERKTRH